MMRLRDEHSEEVDEDVFALACGPDRRVRKYSSCIVNGFILWAHGRPEMGNER